MLKIDPMLLVVLMVVTALASIVTSLFVPEPASAELIRSAGVFLLGLAIKRPGDLTATTHPDDIK
jgi:hypothetical protein